MPAPSRWMIRSAMCYLLAGSLIGAAMLISKAYPAWAPVWLLLPVHIEVMIFGWIIQFTIGTAYWILPRYLETGDRGSASMARAMVGLFNAGIVVNVLSYIHLLPASGIFWGRLLETGAVLLFIFLHWNRAVSYR